MEQQEWLIVQQQEWLMERERLLGRIKELEAENAELRKRLGEDVTPTEKLPTAMQNLSLQKKVGHAAHRLR